MSVWDYLVAWPNVPFTIAVGATLLFALVQASGLAGILGGHAFVVRARNVASKA